ncbi:MAG: hypothetical protein EVB11_12945 [Winogradskyella sp.]|nr:MAG: hypothetical protein EVB11_12945 [Winogradskyella sp.]
MKNFLRVILVILILMYVIIPSVKLLLLSDDIKQKQIANADSYKIQKGKVLNVQTILAEKYPVNYDRDSFKRIYSYQIISENSKVADTLYETVKKSTYFFEQLKPSYSIGDVIDYYKSETDRPKLLTVMNHDVMMDNTKGSPIKWFSLILLVIGVTSAVLLTKTIFKTLKL